MLTNDKQLLCVERGLHDALKLSRLACIWYALWHVNKFEISTRQTSGYRDMVSVNAVTTAKFQNAVWQIVALIEKDEALAGDT